jgi:hypothetical protein
MSVQIANKPKTKAELRIELVGLLFQLTDSNEPVALIESDKTTIEGLLHTIGELIPEFDQVGTRFNPTAQVDEVYLTGRGNTFMTVVQKMLELVEVEVKDFADKSVPYEG